MAEENPNPSTPNPVPGEKPSQLPAEPSNPAKPGDRPDVGRPGSPDVGRPGSPDVGRPGQPGGPQGPSKR